MYDSNHRAFFWECFSPPDAVMALTYHRTSRYSKILEAILSQICWRGFNHMMTS